MHHPTVEHFAPAVPLTDSGAEAASRIIKIIVADKGAFDVEGARRTAFVVGARAEPIGVAYIDTPDCREWRLPPWMARALLDVPGGDLVGRVANLADMPATPYRNALLSAHPDPVAIARTALADWTAGRGRVSTQLAALAWAMIERDPGCSAEDVAARLGVSDRRLREVMRAEIGLSVSTLRRLLRHEQAMVFLQNMSTSIAEAAHAAGYADQSHMTRDVAAMSGLPPARLRAAMFRDGT